MISKIKKEIMGITNIYNEDKLDYDKFINKLEYDEENDKVLLEINPFGEDEVINKQINREIVKSLKINLKISGVKIINNVEHIKINPFEKVKVISIVSAKGGVGKSNVAFKIANELVRRGKKVALVDADILGSSIPKLAGEFSELNVLNGKILPNKLSNGLEIISSQYFISNSNNKAIVWRATIFNSLLRKFFEETKYQDDLEYLILDMPPGTGDTLLNLNAYFEEVYSIVVTTPSEDANYVSLRIVDVLKDLNHKIIGLINNMAFYDVQEVKHYIFGKEDIRGICLQKKIKFLGDIPIKGEDKYFSNDYLDKYYIKIVEDIVHEVDKY